MKTSLFARISAWFEDRPVASAASAAGHSAWEQGKSAIADVTRWGWLPALSGVAIAADHAARTHRESAAPPAGDSR